MNQNMDEQRKQIQNLEKRDKESSRHVEILEKQLAQVASDKATSSQNPLPAQPHPNPIGNTYGVNAITVISNPSPAQTHPNPDGGTFGANAIKLRSGTKYEGPKRDNVEDKSELEGEGDECENEEKEKEGATKERKGEKNEEVAKKKKNGKTKPPAYDPKYEHPPPYPHRLVERKMGDKFKRFMELMKGLQVNMPFLQAIAQMPTYAKFLKDLLSNKSKLEEAELVQLPHQISAMVQKSMPKKYSDPGSFTLPVRIGDLEPIGALADLGAGVSLMPLCIAKKLNFEMVPSRKTIQLADRSIRVPDGQLIDIPIRVGHLVVPCDFIVMEMDPDPNTPLILGREALKTLGAMVNCRNNTITLEVADEKIVFEFSKTMKQPMVPKICRIQTMDAEIEELGWKSYCGELEPRGGERHGCYGVEGPLGGPEFITQDVPVVDGKDFSDHL